MCYYLIVPVITLRYRVKIRGTNLLLKEFGAKPVRLQTIVQEYLKIGQRVRPFVTNTVLVIHRAMAAGNEILFEGAQGTFLDIDHGT